MAQPVVPRHRNLDGAVRRDSRPGASVSFSAALTLQTCAHTVRLRPDTTDTFAVNVFVHGQETRADRIIVAIMSAMLFAGWISNMVTGYWLFITNACAVRLLTEADRAADNPWRCALARSAPLTR